MAWQILAIWAIVMGTITWFIRDERRLIANATMAQAAFFYERPRADESEGPALAQGHPLPRRHGLSSADRQFLKALSENS